MARGKKGASKTATILPAEKHPFSIPQNWIWTDIDSINHYVGTSIDPLKQPDTLFELYSVPSSADDYPEIIAGSEIGSTKQSVMKNDVLLCKINPRINRVWKVSQHTDNELMASSEWIIVRNGAINPDYLMYCFRTQYFREYMLSNVSGVGGSLMRAQPKFVKNYPVPIAPFAEQQRIVDRIESLFAKLDEAKEKAQAVVDGFELRKSAILHQAFTGELTKEWRQEHGVGMENWERTTISSLGTVKGGKRIPKGMSLVSKNTGHPYIRAGNLKQGTVIDEGIMYVPDDVLQYIRQYTVKSGDVYITNVGACIGDCGVIPDKYDGANFTENAVKITDLECNERFLAIYLSSSTIQQKIKTLIASATLGKLSIANIKAIPIFLPTIEEQLEIVRILDDLLSNEQQAKDAAEAVLDQIDTMKKAILARAFRGELGTNDPEEESAEELLRGIL